MIILTYFYALYLRLWRCYLIVMNLKFKLFQTNFIFFSRNIMIEIDPFHRVVIDKFFKNIIKALFFFNFATLFCGFISYQACYRIYYMSSRLSCYWEINKINILICLIIQPPYLLTHLWTEIHPLIPLFVHKFI